MERKILHIDLDAFFCAVEERLNPALCNRPFAVGGRPESRGVVASCSYAARWFGVRSAMPMSRAMRLCPKLEIVSPHFRAYRDASRQVMDSLNQFTPLVEQVSIDEAFLDLSDLGDAGEALAFRVQQAVHSKLGLPCSIGVATNKLVAKTATDVAKASCQTGGYPNTILVVHAGQERDFLAPLPVEMLWGVGPKMKKMLAELGLFTVGDIARRDENYLTRHFGKWGHELALRSRGIDDRPVIISHEPKSVSQEETFVHDVNDRDTLLHTLRTQSDQVGRRLRRINRTGCTVRLKLRLPDFTTVSRQTTLAQPTDQDDEIYAAAVQLFDRLWKDRQPIRLLGVGVSGLNLPVRQLSLWDASSAKHRRLQATLDTLRDRFDDSIIRRGSDLTND